MEIEHAIVLKCSHLLGDQSRGEDPHQGDHLLGGLDHTVLDRTSLVDLEGPIL